MQAFKSMIILALPFLVVATPLTTRTNSPTCNANTGSTQCCNKTKKATEPGVASLLGLFGIVTELTGDLHVGLQCSPILLGGNSCSQQAVCCSGNNFNGLVVLGCSPLDLEL